MKPSLKGHRPSHGRWPKLEKALVQAFADRRKEGETVRKKWSRYWQTRRTRLSAGSQLGSKGKLPVEPVSLARNRKRLEGVHRQYLFVELFPSITDTENDEVFYRYDRMDCF